MSNAVRLSEERSQRGLWLVAMVFATSLIGLGHAIVDVRGEKERQFAFLPRLRNGVRRPCRAGPRPGRTVTVSRSMRAPSSRRGNALRCVLAASLIVIAAGGCAAFHPASEPMECQRTKCDLAMIVSEIVNADYQGKVDYLQFLAAELTGYSAEHPQRRAALYWRAFAFWRQALNALNDGAQAAQVDAPLAACVAGFETLLGSDPTDVEAQAGYIGCTGARLYLWPDRAAALLDRRVNVAKMVSDLKAAGATNPRAAWVAALTVYRWPESRGGGLAQTMAYMESVLDVEQPAPADPLLPTWGRPELYASLGWMQSEYQGRGERPASTVAKALAIRPDWKYAKETLLPQVRAP